MNDVENAIKELKSYADTPCEYGGDVKNLMEDEIRTVLKEIESLRKFIQKEYDTHSSCHPYSVELRTRYPWLASQEESNK